MALRFSASAGVRIFSGFQSIVGGCGELKIK